MVPPSPGSRRRGGRSASSLSTLVINKNGLVRPRRRAHERRVSRRRNLPPGHPTSRRLLARIRVRWPLSPWAPQRHARGTNRPPSHRAPGGGPPEGGRLSACSAQPRFASGDCGRVCSGFFPSLRALAALKRPVIEEKRAPIRVRGRSIARSYRKRAMSGPTRPSLSIRSSSTPA